MTYHLQFFRQWLQDIGVDDLEFEGSLEQAKSIAQATLETLGRERNSRFKPRTSFIIEAETREVLVAYRLTDDGPVELPLGSNPPQKAVTSKPRLRLVGDAANSNS